MLGAPDRYWASLRAEVLWYAGGVVGSWAPGRLRRPDGGWALPVVSDVLRLLTPIAAVPWCSR